MNIWKYNQAFAFTSLKVKEDHSVKRGHGPPVFRIQGELFHHRGPLEPAPHHDPTYSQLYIYDPQATLEHCHHQNAGMWIHYTSFKELFLTIINMQPSISMHIKFLQGYDPQEDVCIRLHVAPGSDHRCYNLPTADEVAVILPTNANPEKTS